MRKITVAEYAREREKTPTAIYQMIGKGKLRAEKIGGKTYIFTDTTEKKEVSNSSEELLKLEIKMLKELLKSKDAEIETLKASLSVFTMVFNNRLNEKPTIQEAEIISTKMKNKKKNKKRNF
jgi:hypothetical protein